jgi:hypothetical protein
VPGDGQGVYIIQVVFDTGPLVGKLIGLTTIFVPAK